MAKTITGSTSSSVWTFKLVVTENSTSTTNNTSSVTVEAFIGRGSSGSYMYGAEISCEVNVTGCDSKTISYSNSGQVNVSANSWLSIGSKTFTVPHDSDGSKTITVSAEFDNNVSPSSGEASGTMELTDIPRYATVTQSLNSKSSSSITMKWSSDSTIDYIWYSTNNGSSWTGINVSDGKSGTYTISELSANTAYKIKTRVRRKDSQLTTDSSTLSVTTYKKTTPTISLSSKSINSITVKSDCNVSVSSTQYRIKSSGGSYGSYQTSATFSGLSPNTSYTIQVKKVGSDSGESGTATLAVTTYQVAQISSASNFNLGSNASVTITNPASATANLVMKVGSTQILSKNLSTGANTILFTDAQLDTIYKLFGNSNTVTVSYTLTTNSNSSWKSTKSVTCALTGNQKCLKLKVSSSWKRALIWIKISGAWKRAVLWAKTSNTWKRGI